MQACVRLADVAADLTALAIMSDSADEKIWDGRLVRDVPSISAEYPSPAGAPCRDGPGVLDTVSFGLFLPRHSLAFASRFLSPAQKNSSGYDRVPALQTRTPCLSGYASSTEERQFAVNGRPQKQVRFFAEHLVRGRVLKHPRTDGTWIMRRNAFNSTATKDLASGRGSTAVLEYLALAADELDDPVLALRPATNELRVTKCRLHLFALKPFTNACLCVGNALF